MQSKDLNLFNDLPFLFWAKDENGVYIWGNSAINEAAHQSVIGKSDHALPWAESAESLHQADQRVFETGKAQKLIERVIRPGQGKVTYHVCKWLGELDGEKCCFGISFEFEQ